MALKILLILAAAAVFAHTTHTQVAKAIGQYHARAQEN